MNTAKRLTALVGTFVLTGLFSVTQAFAQTPYPPKVPPEEVLPTVVFPAGQPVTDTTGGGGGGGSLAFTGAELTLLLGVLAVLLVTGGLALMAGRRRGNATA